VESDCSRDRSRSRGVKEDVVPMMSRLSSLWRNIAHRERVERDIDDEVRTLFDSLVDEEIQGGMCPEDARRSATLDLGGVAALKERIRDVKAGAFLDTFLLDIRYGMRMLRKHPSFALAAIVTLGLGIGANTAIFTLVDALALRSLPVREPSELVYLEMSTQTGRNSYFSYPMFERVQERTMSLSGLAAITSLDRVNVANRGEPEIATGALVTGTYFDVLGLVPELGRLLGPHDDRSGQAVAVISDGYWRRRFGGRPDIVGTVVLVRGLPVTIVGVTPPSFFGIKVGRSVDVTMPMGLRDRLAPEVQWRNQPFDTWLQLLGRLKPSVSQAESQAEVDAVFQRSMAEFTRDLPEAERAIYKARTDVIMAATGLEASAFVPALRLLMWVAAIVLLIACANIANLLMARSEARKREIAVRLAIGAGRGRLVRQFLTESTLIGIFGAALGLGVAVWGSAAIVGMVAHSSPSFVLDVRPETRVLSFTAIISLATVFMFGMAPAFRAIGIRSAPLIADVRPSLSERSGLGWNRILVTGQLALSLVLVFAAGLFVRTVEKASAENGGFNRQNVLTFSTDPSLLGYDPVKTSALHAAILAALRTIPGVDVASAALARPVNPQAYYVSGFRFIDGRVLQPNERVRLAWNAVSEDYFKTLEIPILAGRSFRMDDGWNSPRVAIVNETLARQLFPGQSPIGFTIGRNQQERTEIVGVARDTKYADLLSDVRAVAYFPIYQFVPSDVTFLVRYAGQSGPILNAARERIANLDRNLPIYRVNTLEAEASAALLRQRLLALVSTAFGLLALALACIGLYGLMAFAVARRLKEIAVRMALGADQRQVLWMMSRESLRMIAVGVVIGVPSALALMRLARTFLFGLTPADPMTLTATIIVLTVVAVVAGYIPARRASRIEPMVALRLE
jgi:predicted permease